MIQHKHRVICANYGVSDRYL